MIIGITGYSGVLGAIFLKQIQQFPSCTVIVFRGRVENQEELINWLSENEFNCILHFAAVVPVEIVTKNPYSAIEINCIGTHNLLKAIKQRERPLWFFYASTSHVYASSGKPISEGDKKDPINHYGITKLIGEIFCENFEKEYPFFKLCIGRIFSYYHESQKPPFLFPSITERARNHNINEEFKLQGANNVRDFLNAEQVISIIIKLLHKQAVGTVNIASGKPTTIGDFVLQNISADLKIISDDHTPTYLVADVSKLKSILEN